MRVLFLLLCLVGCHGGSNEPVPTCSRFAGIHLNALPHKDFSNDTNGICSNVIAALEGVECPAISFLLGSFGDSFECLNRVVHSFGDRENLIEIYVSNESCRRHGTCDVGDFATGSNVGEVDREIEGLTADEEYKSRLNVIADLAKSFPSKTHLLITPGLEDQFSHEAFKHLVDLQRATLPALSVRNPVKDQFLLNADLFESHGLEKTCNDEITDIVSQDGEVTPDDASFLARTHSCLASFLWRPEWQGRTRAVDGSLEPASESPRLRRMKFGADEAKEINALLKNAGR